MACTARLVWYCQQALLAGAAKIHFEDKALAVVSKQSKKADRAGRLRSKSYFALFCALFQCSLFQNVFFYQLLYLEKSTLFDIYGSTMKDLTNLANMFGFCINRLILFVDTHRLRTRLRRLRRRFFCFAPFLAKKSDDRRIEFFQKTFLLIRI